MPEVLARLETEGVELWEVTPEEFRARKGNSALEGGRRGGEDQRAVGRIDILTPSMATARRPMSTAGASG